MKSKYLNFEEIVDLDIFGRKNAFWKKLAESDFLRIFMILIIILDCLVIVLSTQTTMVADPSIMSIFRIIHWVTFSFFLLEFFLKLSKGLLLHFKDYWNILDATLLLIFSFQPENKALYNLGIIRVFRVIQPFRDKRLTSYLAGARTILVIVENSLPGILKLI
jgi:hypothetical protein